MSYDQYYKTFNVSKEMRLALAEKGKEYGVKPDYVDMAQHKDLFNLHVKAQIARQIWKNDGFYPIFNQTNEVLQQAIKLFDEAENLDRSKL